MLDGIYKIIHCHLFQPQQFPDHDLQCLELVLLYRNQMLHSIIWGSEFVNHGFNGRQEVTLQNEIQYSYFSTWFRVPAKIDGSTTMSHELKCSEGAGGRLRIGWELR